SDYGIYALNVETGARRVIVAGDPNTRTGFGGSPQLSPDGNTIAVGRSVHGHDRGIWWVNADGSDARPLVDHAAIADLYDPPGYFQDWLMGSWSPDGRELTFNVDGHHYFVLGEVNADGSEVRRLTSVRGNSLGSSWSPDGSQIAATN